MTAFRYKALTSDGRKVAGTVEAATRREAGQALREQGMHVTDLAEAGATFAAGLRQMGARRSEDAYLFTSHMRRLIRARLPLVEALDATAQQFEGTAMGAVIRRVRDKVSGGTAFSEALSAERAYFSDLYVAMIQAAQVSGNMPAAFDNIYQYETSRREFHRRLTSAMAYPIVLVCVAFFVVLFLVSYVVPRIETTLVNANIALPVTTRALMVAGHFSKSYWYLLLAAIALAVFSPGILRASAPGRLFYDRTVLRLPVLGKFAAAATVSRFARTFSALLSTGLRVADAIDIAGKVSGNVIFEKAISQARSRVVSGGDLAGALGETRLLPTYAVQIVSVGERTGTLADSFTEISRSEEESLQVATDRFLTFLEPAIILLMAGVVGFILASIFLPLLSMSSIGT